MAKNPAGTWERLKSSQFYSHFKKSPVAIISSVVLLLILLMAVFGPLLLTNKPILFAANMSEEDFSGDIEQNPFLGQVEAIAKKENAGVLPICAQIEADIAGMDPEEKALFLSDMGLQESGLDRLINACYSLLGLISYLTAGKDECRAWTITRGTKAPQAAGKIHSDFERGFIRAYVISFEDLMACGTMTAAKEKGLVRSEGKEYVMQDGDIVHFLFNV